MSVKPRISISNRHFGIWKCCVGDEGPVGYAGSPYVAWVMYVNALRQSRRVAAAFTITK